MSNNQNNDTNRNPRQQAQQNQSDGNQQPGQQKQQGKSDNQHKEKEGSGKIATSSPDQKNADSKRL